MGEISSPLLDHGPSTTQRREIGGKAGLRKKLLPGLCAYATLIVDGKFESEEQIRFCISSQRLPLHQVLRVSVL